MGMQMRVIALLAVGSLIVGVVSPAQAQTLRKPAKPADFNGDGKVDIAVGNRFAKVGKAKSAGAATITYGGTGRHQVLSLNSAGVPGTAAAGGLFWSDLVSADFDRDGYADLAANGDGSPDIVIVYGGRKGLSKRAVRVKSPGGVYRLAVGDFNRNGKPDLVMTWLFGYGVAYDLGTGHHPKVVSMKSSDPHAEQSETGANSVPGDFTGDGFTDLATFYQPDTDSSTTDHRTYLELRKGSRTGLGAPVYTLAPPVGRIAGDFNGDGRADLVSNVYESGKQAVQVVYGTPTGFSKPVSPEKGPHVFSPEGTAVHTGAATTVGDVNRDGYADVAVGRSQVTVAGKANAGRVLVFYGSAKGLTSRRSLVLTENTPGIPGTAGKLDAFGELVTFADVTGDGRPELFVRARGEQSGRGTIYVFRNVKGRIVAAKPKVSTGRSYGFATALTDYPLVP
jgi:hypothetical protein